MHGARWLYYSCSYMNGYFPITEWKLIETRVAMILHKWNEWKNGQPTRISMRFHEEREDDTFFTWIWTYRFSFHPRIKETFLDEYLHVFYILLLVDFLTVSLVYYFLLRTNYISHTKSYIIYKSEENSDHNSNLDYKLITWVY